MDLEIIIDKLLDKLKPLRFSAPVTHVYNPLEYARAPYSSYLHHYAKLPKEQAAPNREEWDWKRDGVAQVIAELKPTILALQEVENQRVLYYLTKRLRDHHNLHYRIAFIQGTDYYTEQDVAILYQSGLIEYSRREQSREMWDSERYYNVSKHLFAGDRENNSNRCDW